MHYYVYILASKKNGTLYTGVTNDLVRRVLEHKNKIKSGFTSRYNVDRLVYYEKWDIVFEAIRREKEIKKYRRRWKINLIESKNPNWDDLSQRSNFIMTRIE